MFAIQTRRKLTNLYYGTINPFRTVYWFIFRPKTRGAKCVVEYQGKILLVRLTYAHDKWTFPGGKVEKQETFQEAAGREIMEELGIKVSSLIKIGEYESRRYYKRDTVYCFRGQASSFDFKIDEMEIREAKWFASDEVPAYRAPTVDKILEIYLKNEKARPQTSFRK